MDTDLLKTFLEVYQTRHFGKAAENLYLTQAAVSARIKQLESVLGSQLFSRLRNNLRLTETGERLVPHAQAILIAWERARQEVSVKKENKIPISIGSTNGLWDLLLQDHLIAMQPEFENVVFTAKSLNSETLIRSLMERTLDLALVYEPAKITDLASIPVIDAELTLFTSKPIESIEDIVSLGYIAVDWGTAFDIELAKELPGITSQILKTNLARIALEFLLSQGGCAYLPYLLAQPYLGTRLATFSDAPVIKRPVFACFHKDNPREEILTKFLAGLTF